MENWKEFIKKHHIIIILAVILAGAIFVRTYHFSDWLYFKSDQVRDAKLSYEAFYNGAGELPLLGPRAAGTFLRLGPIFYYFQYFSAKIFYSVEPQAFAFPDLLFSILTIPLVFVFSRKFFSKNLSLLITVLYSFSFIIIQYSRFGWNPNSIPFWGLLFILSIFNTSQTEDKKRAGWWLASAGAAYGILSQLHFMTLVGFPAIAVIFWIFYPPRKINWKYWLGAIALVLFLYIPVIISDFKTNGDNARQFVYALTAKTGTELYTPKESIKQISTTLFSFLSSFGNKDNNLSAAAGAVLIFAGLAAMLYFWIKNKKQRPFLLLVAVWFVIFIGLLIETNTSLKPRFFLPIAIIPFVFWGMIFAGFLSSKNKIISFIAALSFVSFLFLNFNGIKIGYQFLKNQDIKAITRPIYLQQEDAKTLKQIKLASDYMVKKTQINGKMICFNVSADYERSFEYVFSLYYPQAKYDRISKSMENKDNCDYFSIATADDTSKKISNRYVDYFIFGKAEKIGRFNVWDIFPKEEFIHYNQDEDKSRQSAKNEVSEKDEWEDTGSDISDTIDENADNSEENQPKKEERVFWKDVL